KNNLIYYSGNFVTYNFALIHRKIIYNLIYNKTIDKNFLDILAKIDIIVFYSCNAAKNFLELLDEQAFLNLLSHKKIVTLSYKIAQLFTKISDEVFYSNDSCNEQLLAIIKWIIANQSKNQFLPMPPFMLCL
ncbi:MAG: hypothetical protein K9G11_03035, partial [Rickettsiaceae bacterium]|nr:hypothetical protein [Rickettsiaceae bacterium]